MNFRYNPNLLGDILNTKIAINYIENTVITLLFIFFITEHHVEFTAVKNISLYLALLLGLSLIFTDFKRRISNIKSNFLNAKFELSFLGVFVAYAFLVSLFPYSYEYDSFKNAFKEFGRGIAFLLIILILADENKNKEKIFFYSILTAFFCITIYYCYPLFSEFDKISSANFEEGRIINRKYALFADRFMVFALIAILLFRQYWLKSLAILFCLLVVVMDIFTGARGSWLSVFVSFVLLSITLSFSSYKEFLKANFKKIAAICIVATALLGFIFANSSVFIYKFSQGTYSSGRDLILKERLPMLFSSDRAFVGLGYGPELYDQFLSDKMDETGIEFFMMQMYDSRRHWFNDEPFFIGNYYYFGVIGITALFLAFISLLISSFKEFRRTQNLLFLGVFISTISYFGIRGLFETYNLRILYLFYMIGFFVLIKAKFSNSSKTQEIT